MPPCWPICRSPHVTSHPTSHLNTVPSIYRWRQWRWKTFLTLAQGHAVTHSENIRDSVLIDLSLKGRLFQVLNQVGVKSYECIELPFTFDEQFSLWTPQKFRWNLKVAHLPLIIHPFKAEQNGWEENRTTRKNTCLQNVISTQLGMGPIHYRKHKVLGKLSRRSSSST